ncbi:putative oxidoreductase [Rhodotorula diobovata]|uniref:Putative oxidoreductase n=1 Tax=Rhodotorula diobovata TaxID=5288 RepID=A0A5C5G382_9BASI|nr:putative oxidoreductase [Rhodotorula diobovata]
MSASNDLLFQMAKLAVAGKTVLVTGASGEIGFAVAKAFRQSGAHLVLTGSNQDKLDKSVQGLPAGEGKVWSYVCDLRSREQTEEFVRKTVDECSPVDILVNNAGFALAADAPFWEQDLDNVSTVMDVNVRGLMNVTHGVLKYHMMKRAPHPAGTILMMSSITGHQAPLKEFFEASYHTSKAAIEGFSNVLRHELVGTNVRVLVHRPGFVDTEFHRRRNNYDEAKTAAMFEGVAPLVADDIATGVLWQCAQLERVSVVLMETLPTSQRSLYSVDREWEKRNGSAE